jgi:hypothetical protein
MNRTYNPVSRIQRSVFATAAVLATVITFGSIGGLVEYYSAGPVLAAVQPVAVAER